MDHRLLQRPRPGALLLALICVCLIACAKDDARKLLGETCERDAECSSSRCDELICKSSAPAGPDAPCDSPYECASENCMLTPDGGRCGPGLREDGRPCTDPLQCTSAQCLGAVCTATPVDATPPAPDAGVDLDSDSGAVDAALPDPGWSLSFGDSDADYVLAIAVDGAGNVYLTGEMRGTAQFGADPLVSAGDSDVFLASFDRSGKHRWSKRFGGALADRGASVAVDANGNVVLTGYFQVGIEVGGTSYDSGGGYDLFLASFDTNGAHRWSKTFGGLGIEVGEGVIHDGRGNIVVTGHVASSVDFGGGTLGPASQDDVFLASFDPDGNHRWSKRFGGINNQHALGVGRYGAQDLVICGQFEGTLTFGSSSLVSVGDFDAFVATFDPTGTPRWAKRFGSSGLDRAWAVAGDTAGNVYATGYFTNDADFDGETLIHSGAQDAFLVSYDGSGNKRWLKHFGHLGDEAGFSIAIDGRDNVTLAGSVESSFDFGGGLVPTHGSNDAFVVSLNAAGDYRWSRLLGGATQDVGRAVALGSDGGVLLGGYFSGTADFGFGPLTSSGSWDVFLLRFIP